VDGVRRRVDLLDPDRRSLWLPHLALALAGLWVLWPDPRVRWVLAAPLAFATLLFFGYVRVGVAYLPAIWILQGAAVAALASRAGPARLGPLAGRLALVVGALLLAAEWAGA